MIEFDDKEVQDLHSGGVPEGRHLANINDIIVLLQAAVPPAPTTLRDQELKGGANQPTAMGLGGLGLTAQQLAVGHSSETRPNSGTEVSLASQADAQWAEVAEGLNLARWGAGARL